ncbi:NUDIX hydrolase [Flectobacillus major]|jgi:NADH pyrophosphatase NudC (nudix superfamily)|uniref:NUDIX hydrolase n=1 Tax=Flectobacillus major TaxID=103 RepID=UPI00040B7467|nr:NUDIX hydrolase [Flectobacillus major]
MSKMKYCPQCGKELVLKLKDDRERLACNDDLSCGFVHWNNPIPVVAAIVEHEGDIILARNAAWPTTWYALITGFLESGETPEEGILREVKEELNLDGEIVELVGLYEFHRMNQLLITYHVRATGIIQLSEELVDYQRKKPEEIKPWPAGTGRAVQDWQARRGIFNEMVDFTR